MSGNDQNPPTLASLRRTRTKPRPTPAPAEDKQTASQLGLLFNTPPTPKTPEPKPLPLQRRIWTVRDLVSDVRRHVETNYTDLWVEGEISNFRAAPSGHLYFTLKDGEAQLPIVLFRRQALLLRFRPADGLAVLVRGRISIYEARGQLQLTAETLEPRGAGALQLAFEQPKARLLAEGLFDAARKRPLPPFPHCVGIITSPSGAVIRDIVNVISRRHARLNLLIYPAAMQGANCCSTVAAGIRWFNRHPEKADLIIIARGGGSIEDLSGFNDESLVRTIAVSKLPIVSAIGHETDFTISDFVADLRAPTPSAAAELVTTVLHNIADRIGNFDQRLQRAARYRLMQASTALARVQVESILIRERDQLRRRQQRVDDLTLRMQSHWGARHRGLADKLQQLSVRLLQQDVVSRTAVARERLASLEARALRAQHDHLRTLRDRQIGLARHLTALSPLAVLNRGYALVYDDHGALIKDAESVTEGQSIIARLARGRIHSQVSEIEKETQRS
jgi:exodeoxyribonuclease VII large subunit